MTLLDLRGRVLAYAHTLSVHGSTVGVTGATFAPSSLNRLATGRARVTAISAGRPVLVLRGLRLRMHAGVELPEGGWVCEAAVGTFSAAEKP
ncbi:MAG: hypothetical protein HYT96_03000 [Armatimonadetes bacterium]|nr:hypothetical protein [Armatimonadota bacterium]MBI2246530.1 hypothetical protein [Armatimonadota bacterium]MBI2972286.1 hypothetical protein [Armatimonadota bacterium]